jgi:hypothetical protein
VNLEDEEMQQLLDFIAWSGREDAVFGGVITSCRFAMNVPGRVLRLANNTSAE